jgi:putative endonuclease
MWLASKKRDLGMPRILHDNRLAFRARRTDATDVILCVKGERDPIMTVRAVSRIWIEFQARVLGRLHALAIRRRSVPEHLQVGQRGEREALFHLRKMGYTVVARRWKSAKLWGDIDLIGWDGRWLCFIEVKTRSGRDAIRAEVAVDGEKQDMLRRMARAYLRGFPERLRADVPVRFDVVSVYLLATGVEFDLYPGAFGW